MAVAVSCCSSTKLISSQCTVCLLIGLQQWEPGYEGKPLRDIARELFRLCRWLHFQVRPAHTSGTAASKHTHGSSLPLQTLPACKHKLMYNSCKCNSICRPTWQLSGRW